MIAIYKRPVVLSYLGDKRLESRLTKIVKAISQDIGTSISQCMVKWSQIKATYRFMSNKKVTHRGLIAMEETELVKKLLSADTAHEGLSKRLVLHIQDTTTANYSKQKSAKRLPCLNYVTHRGYFVHTSLVTDSAGCIEGILDQKVWGRSDEDLGTSKDLQIFQKTLPIECKESERWVSHFELFQSQISALPNTRGISISDSESDIYELFMAKSAENVDLIARSHHNRKLIASTHKADMTLDTYVSNLPVEGHCYLEVLKEDKHTYRPVELAISFGEVAIELPETLKWSSSLPRAARRLREKMAAKNGLRLRVIHIKEINPIEGIKPIDWTLLTTLSINDYWDALQAVQYYALRWRIEIFHMVLKQGYAIENLQLENPQPIQNAIALYSIVAAKVTALRYLAQTQAQKPMTLTGFTPNQYNFLSQYLITNYDLNLHKPIMLPQIPTVEQFVHLLVCLAGGHKGNKNKDIGIRQLWKGLNIAKIILQAYDAAVAFNDS